VIARTVIARRVYIRRPALLIAGIESPARSALVRLETGEWTLAEPGEYGSEQWRHPKHGNECRMVAISMARKAAKKGSAQQP